MLKKDENREVLRAEIRALRRKAVELLGTKQHRPETDAAFSEREQRHRQLFQSAPIALIERDASHLKACLEQLRESGVSDFRAYLEGNPRRVRDCWSLIKTVDYNPAFRELMGLPVDTVPRNTYIPTDSKDFMRLARDIILMIAWGETTSEREATLVTATGESRVVWGKSMVAAGHEKTLDRVIIALVDISRRKEAEKLLRESERRSREQSLRDGLTGLYNQRYLYQSLAEWIERSKIAGAPISLIFIDLDHFKKVVDTHGHPNGSRIIRKVAQTIDNCLKAPDYAVAYAGDEFVVILPDTDRSRARRKAAEIRNQVKNSVYRLDREVEVRLQASFGTATFPRDAGNMNDLIAAADQALFTVKKAGKGAIGQFGEKSPDSFIPNGPAFNGRRHQPLSRIEMAIL